MSRFLHLLPVAVMAICGRQALAAPPADVNQAMAEARASYFANQLPEAQAPYRRLIDAGRLSQDQLPEAYLALGNTYMFQEDYVAALAVFAEGAQSGRIGPRNRSRLAVQKYFAIGGQLRLAERRLAADDYGNAADLFHAAVTMTGEPGRHRAQALLGLSAALAAQRQTSDADAVLDELLHAPGPLGDEYRERSEALLRKIRLKLAAHDTTAASRLADQFVAQPVIFPPHLELLNGLLTQAGMPIPTVPAPPMGAADGPNQPIGGGPGYEPTIAAGDRTASTREAFLAALESWSQLDPDQRQGKVLFVPGRARIDLSGLSRLVVPSGVTVASDRGRNGSPGGLLFYTGPAVAKDLLLLQDRARLTGLRLQGDSKSFAELQQLNDRQLAAYFAADRASQPGTVCIAVYGRDCQIDNCEFVRFARGISIENSRAWIHHNKLLDISPYPICLGVMAQCAILEANEIQWMWHAVASTFSPLNGYVARNNIFRETSPNLFARGVSGQFAADSHGLGECFILHHNTFLHEDPGRSVPNRGICIADPPGYAWITANWFRDPMPAERALSDRKQYGKEPYDPAKGPRQVSRWRDLPWHHRTYLESARELDFRDMAAMPRDGSGGAGFWIFQNAYGLDKQVLPHTIFSTPEIVIRSPLFRRWPALPPDPGKLQKGVDAQWFFFLCPALPRLERPFAVEFDVLHLPELPLSEVAVFLVKPNPKNVYRAGYRPTGSELQEIYRADKPPQSGRLRVDPTELAPGVYGLCVEAADRRGIRAAQLTYFEVPATRKSQ